MPRRFFHMTDLLVNADADVVDNALATVDGLAPIERCPKPAGDAEAYWNLVGLLADGIRAVST